MWRWIDAGVGATMIAIVLVGLASTGTLAQAALIGTRWAAMSVALSPTPVVAPLSTITWAATPDAPSHAAARPPSTTTWVGRRERSEGASDGHALVGVNTGHAVATLIPRSRLGARWRAFRESAPTHCLISNPHGRADFNAARAFRWQARSDLCTDASRGLPQDNAGTCSAASWARRSPSMPLITAFGETSKPFPQNRPIACLRLMPKKAAASTKL